MVNVSRTSTKSDSQVDEPTVVALHIGIVVRARAREFECVRVRFVVLL